MSDLLQIICGDALTELRTLPDESVQCCVTSPPYWGLRDYGTAEWEGGDSTCDHKFTVSSPYNENFNERWGNASGAKKQESERHEVSYKSDCGKCGAKRIDSQLGLEKTTEEYVAKMVEVFREVRRVLRKDGTLWLNLGDSYNSSPSNQQSGEAHRPCHDNNGTGRTKRDVPGLKPKDLCGIPWRVAFALQADGWWLRSDIIWSKKNCMPESCTDRPTKSHEYIFLLTKSANYFFDNEAVREPLAASTLADGRNGTGRHTQGETIGSKYHENQGIIGAPPDLPSWYRGKMFVNPEAGRNMRSVWSLATESYEEAHFATFPTTIPKRCIMAGTSAKGCCSSCGAPWERVVERTPNLRTFDGSGRVDERKANDRGGSAGFVDSQTIGWKPSCDCENPAKELCMYPIIPCTVLDPFAGSGTSGMVALELGRKTILIELNPRYIELIEQRCTLTPGLALA